MVAAEPTSSWSYSTIIAMTSRQPARPRAKRRRRRPARHLVVEPPAGEQRLVAADQCRRLHVEQAQLPQRRLVASGLRRDPLPRTRRPPAGRRPTRDEMLLRSSFSPSFTLRSRCMASCGTRATARGRRRAGCCRRPSSAPGDTEVAVEPGVVEDPAVDLDVELLPAELPSSGRGLTRKHGESVWAPTRRKGVTAAAPEGVRHATTLPSSTTNAAAGRSVHGPPSSTSAKPPASNRVADGARRMVRRRRSVEERPQIVDRLHID